MKTIERVSLYSWDAVFFPEMLNETLKRKFNIAAAIGSVRTFVPVHENDKTRNAPRSPCLLANCACNTNSWGSKAGEDIRPGNEKTKTRVGFGVASAGTLK